MEYYSAMKKKNVICSTWIQLKIIILIEVSEKRDRQIPHDITYT